MAFDSLVRHYENVYWIDLVKKTARILKLDASYVDVPGKETHEEFLFDIVIKKWVDTIVYKEDRDKVLNTLSISNVLKTFETKDELVGNYRNFVNGEIHYYQYNVSKVNKDGKLAIIGFQNVDDIIKEPQEIENAKKERSSSSKRS